MLSAEDGSALGARNEGTGVRNKNVGTAFRAGNSEHGNFSGRRASYLRGSFFFLRSHYNTSGYSCKPPMISHPIPPGWIRFAAPKFFLSMEQKESWKNAQPFCRDQAGFQSFRPTARSLPEKGNDFSPFRKKLGIKEKTASIYFSGPKPAKFHNHQESLIDHRMPGPWNKSC